MQRAPLTVWARTFYLLGHSTYQLYGPTFKSIGSYIQTFKKPFITTELNREIFRLPSVRYSTIDNLPEITEVEFNEIIQLNTWQLDTFNTDMKRKSIRILLSITLVKKQNNFLKKILNNLLRLYIDIQMDAYFKTLEISK